MDLAVASRQVCGLICDDSDRAAVQPCKSDHEIPCVVFLHFEEIVFVNDGMNDVFDVVGNVRFGRHNRVQ